MKTALITGASSGIGYEFALEHARNGGDLIITARGEHQLNMLKQKVESDYKVKCEVIALDLCEEHAAKKLMDAVQELGMSVDYLINNAGFGYTERFDNAEISTFQQMIQLNITAVMDLCYYFVKEKKSEKKAGKILNVASTAAYQGIPYVSVYAATKAFVLSFSEGLAGELKEDDITVTALCPGPTRSNFGNNSNVDAKFANSPLFPSAASVAKYGYTAMLEGNKVAVHGIGNKIGVLSTRLTSRRTVGNLAGKLFKMGMK